MQDRLIAGDTLNYRSVPSEYSPADGWSLTLRLVPRSADETAHEVAGVADGSTWLVRTNAGLTAAWAPGWYSWAAYVSNAGGERYTIDRGQLEVLRDPGQAQPGVDGRSQAQRALDDAKAAFAAWTPTQRRYRIADREREFNSPADIIKVIRYWETEVARETGRPQPAGGGRIYYRAS